MVSIDSEKKINNWMDGGEYVLIYIAELKELYLLNTPLRYNIFNAWEL